jgi:inorganic pyrophosphatase
MNLSHLPPFPRKGILRAVIETPKGSRNKFDYDPKLKIFSLAKVLPEGMVFPYDFGFIPQTTGDDGDPLDVLVLLAEPVHPGCVVDCRLVGVMQANQRKKGGRPVRNDRFIAASAAASEFGHLRGPEDLPAQLMREIEEFFVNYNQLEGKVFKVTALKNGGPALKRVKAAIVKK